MILEGILLLASIVDLLSETCNLPVRELNHRIMAPERIDMKVVGNLGKLKLISLHHELVVHCHELYCKSGIRIRAFVDHRLQGIKLSLLVFDLLIFLLDLIAKTYELILLAPKLLAKMVKHVILGMGLHAELVHLLVGGLQLSVLVTHKDVKVCNELPQPVQLVIVAGCHSGRSNLIRGGGDSRQNNRGGLGRVRRSSGRDLGALSRLGGQGGGDRRSMLVHFTIGG